MATLHINLCRVAGRADTGMTLPVPSSIAAGADTVTPSGTSAVSSLEASARDVWTVTAMGGNAWLKFGTGTPLAASDDGWLILDGQTRDFAAMTAGEKIAYMTAT